MRLRLVTAIAIGVTRTAIPVRRLARHVALDPEDLVLNAARFVRIDAVARRAIDPALEVARLGVEVAGFAARQDAPHLHRPDVAADALHPAFHRPREVDPIEAVAEIVRVVAVDRRRPLRGSRGGKRQRRSCRRQGNQELTHNRSPYFELDWPLTAMSRLWRR